MSPYQIPRRLAVAGLSALLAARARGAARPTVSEISAFAKVHAVGLEELAMLFAYAPSAYASNHRPIFCDLLAGPTAAAGSPMVPASPDGRAAYEVLMEVAEQAGIRLVDVSAPSLQ